MRASFKSDLTTNLLLNKIDTADKGASNGVCPLDANGYVPALHIDPNVLEFMGTYDALINSPFLADGVSTVFTGNMYIVSVAGTQFTPAIDFEVGDF